MLTNSHRQGIETQSVFHVFEREKFPLILFLFGLLFHFTSFVSFDLITPFFAPSAFGTFSVLSMLISSSSSNNNSSGACCCFSRVLVFVLCFLLVNQTSFSRRIFTGTPASGDFSGGGEVFQVLGSALSSSPSSSVFRFSPLI